MTPHITPFSQEMRTVLAKAKSFAAGLGHKQVQTYHMLWAIAHIDLNIYTGLHRFGWNFDIVCIVIGAIEPITKPVKQTRLSKEVLQMYGNAMTVAKEDLAKDLQSIPFAELAEEGRVSYLKPIQYFEALLRNPGLHTKILEAFAPVDIIYYEIFEREIAKETKSPIINQVTIE